MCARAARLSEAQALVRALAEPRQAGDTVKAAIGRAARALRHWSYSRVASLWYADPRARVTADEMDTLRRLTQDRRKNDQAASNDLGELRARLARIERLLSEIDPDSLGADRAVVRENHRLAVRASGGGDRART